jgi:hypothetical protein
MVVASQGGVPGFRDGCCATSSTTGTSTLVAGAASPVVKEAASASPVIEEAALASTGG